MKSKLSAKEARRLCLNSQGLLGKPVSGKDKKGLLKVIQQIGYVQIDTISVVARAHHHTPWNRFKGYQKSHLNQLLEEDKSIFEYWSHAASYLPMEHFRFSFPRKQGMKEGKDQWFVKQPELMAQVLKRIREEGPLMARDFQKPAGHGQGEWWNWKPAKKALERLFQEGELMVLKREGFQKVYELTERVLPDGVDTSVPSEEEFARHLVEQSLAAYGLAHEKEIAYLRRGMGPVLRKTLGNMLEAGEILELTVEGIPGKTYYSSPDLLEGIPSRLGTKIMRLLSPFDNLVIQRQRAQDLFGFQYQIECYVPSEKRKWGYFVLPILWGDQFIGRLDAKADRKSGEFLVRKLYFEAEFGNRGREMEAVLPLLAAELREYAGFCGCNRVTIEHCERPGIKAALQALLL